MRYLLYSEDADSGFKQKRYLMKNMTNKLDDYLYVVIKMLFEEKEVQEV